eukprot:403344148
MQTQNFSIVRSGSTTNYNKKGRIIKIALGLISITTLAIVGIINLQDFEQSRSGSSRFLASQNTDQQQLQIDFSNYVSKHNKKYDTSLLKVKTRKTILGRLHDNQFSDWTPEEFEEILGLKQSTSAKLQTPANKSQSTLTTTTSSGLFATQIQTLDYVKIDQKLISMLLYTQHHMTGEFSTKYQRLKINNLVEVAMLLQQQGHLSLSS